MYRKSFMKMAAVLLAAACTVTAVPQAAFADELISSEPVLVAEEPVTADGEALITEDEGAASPGESGIVNDDPADVRTIDEQDEDIPADGDTPVAADWHKPVDYTLGKTVSGTVYDQRNNTPEGRKEGLYYDKRFYKFKTPKDGYYRLTVNSPDDRTEFYLTPEIENYFKSSQPKVRAFGGADPDLDAEVKLLKGQELYLIVNGYTGLDQDKSYEFTFSLEKEVTLFDKANPVEFSLDKAQTLNGTIEADFDGKNISFNDNENLTAHNNFYRFEVKEAGRFNIDVSTDEGVGIYLTEAPYWYYLDSGRIVEWTPGTSTSEKDVKNAKFYADLKKGIYHFRVYNTDGTSNYSIKTEFNPIKAGKNEVVICDEVLGGSRNELKDAYPIDINKKYVAQSSEDTRTKTDWYQLNLSSPSKLYLSLGSTEIETMAFYMRDGVDDTRSISFENFPNQSGISQKEPVVGKQLIAPKYMGYTDTFPKGTYYISIPKWTTGSYHFEISTGANVKVTSIKLDKKSVTLPLNGTDKITATVGPENADNKDVIWEVVDNPVAVELTDNGDGTCTIKGLKAGYAKIKAISSNPDKTAICEVEVLNQEITQNVKTEAETRPMVTSGKVDLSENVYFGSFGNDFQKTDKFVVEPKNAGSVSKGIFSAKKYKGVVKVTRQVKVGKKYVDSDEVSIEIEQPTVKYEKDSKGKDIKFFTASYAGEIFDATERIESKTILPTTWEISDKQGKNFELEKDTEGKPTGKIICKNNGSCKVSAVYGEGKNASRVTFTLKTVMPKLSIVKKDKLSVGQDLAIKLTGTKAGDAISWEFIPDADDDRVTDKTDAVKIEPANAKNPDTQKKITINKVVNGKVVATVNGHSYECIISVLTPEIKTTSLNLPVGKKGVSVGAVKNCKIKDICWMTSNPNVAMITDEVKGTFATMFSGTATVYAEIGGYTVKCEVTVN